MPWGLHLLLSAIVTGAWGSLAGCSFAAAAACRRAVRRCGVGKGGCGGRGGGSYIYIVRRLTPRGAGGKWVTKGVTGRGAPAEQGSCTHGGHTPGKEKSACCRSQAREEEGGGERRDALSPPSGPCFDPRALCLVFATVGTESIDVAAPPYRALSSFPERGGSLPRYLDVV